MIELTDVSMRFGDKTVFSRLSLRFDSPDSYAVLGPSGCGKTTLLRLIAGLQKPTSGLVRITDSPRMAVCFQEDRLLPWKTLLENVALVVPGPDKRKKALRLLDRAGLAGEADALPGALSGGMKRRAALVRALAYDAPVLLLDEPFRALDEALHADMLRLVREYAEGRLLILVTHDMRDAEGMRVLRLDSPSHHTR